MLNNEQSFIRELEPEPDKIGPVPQHQSLNFEDKNCCVQLFAFRDPYIKENNHIFPFFSRLI